MNVKLIIMYYNVTHSKILNIILLLLTANVLFNVLNILLQNVMFLSLFYNSRTIPVHVLLAIVAK